MNPYHIRIISGYSRKHCPMPDFPNDLIGLILKFYPTFHRFDPDLCSPYSFTLHKNDAQIRGSTYDCADHLVYLECFADDGYSTGVHYWTIKSIQHNCCRYLGIISYKNKDLVYLPRKEEIEQRVFQDKQKLQLYPHISFLWNKNAKISLKLDCDRNVFYCYDGHKMEIQFIEPHKHWYFVCIFCHRHVDTFFESIQWNYFLHQNDYNLI